MKTISNSLKTMFVDLVSNTIFFYWLLADSSVQTMERQAASRKCGLYKAAVNTSGSQLTIKDLIIFVEIRLELCNRKDRILPNYHLSMTRIQTRKV